MEYPVRNTSKERPVEAKKVHQSVQFIKSQHFRCLTSKFVQILVF